jgi:hypothetical protein
VAASEVGRWFGLVRGTVDREDVKEFKTKVDQE